MLVGESVTALVGVGERVGAGVGRGVGGDVGAFVGKSVPLLRGLISNQLMFQPLPPKEVNRRT